MEIKPQKSGKDIVLLIYTLVKAIQVYDLNNDVVQNTAQKFVDDVNSLLTTMPTIELLRYRDYVFFDKQRLKFEIYSYASLQFIHDRLKKLQIKSLTFLPGISRDEIIRFASIFSEEREVFLQHVASEKFDHINLESETDEEEMPEELDDEEQQRRENIKGTYLKALKVTKDVMNNVWSNQPVNVTGLRRIVYKLIDFLYEDELSVMALASIKNFDEYTYNHSLNVGVLSMALGHRIGLSKKTLVTLTNAAILHDIGKVGISAALINKSGKLTNEEWEIVKSHANHGVVEILKSKGLDEIGLASMIVSFQHHWNYDGTGYPAREESDEQTLLAKIVRICDAYDAMTTSRPYKPVPYLPHFALRILWSRRNSWFDPILLKVFIQTLGIYPVGTCLELSSGEIGLVIRQNPGSVDLPVVKIVVNKDGKKTSGRTIDLSGRTKRKIVKPTYPQEYGINPALYCV